MVICTWLGNGFWHGPWLDFSCNKIILLLWKETLLQERIKVYFRAFCLLVHGMKGGAEERCCILFRGSVVEMSCVSSGEEGFLQTLRAADLESYRPLQVAKKRGCGGGTVSDPSYISEVGWGSCRVVVTSEAKGVM